MGCCEKKWPFLCARRFHRYNDFISKQEATGSCRMKGNCKKSNEGSDKAESDGDNPPANNAKEGNGDAEEGNDDAEESRDDDTDVEESVDKESVVEKSNEQVGDSKLATTLEARSKRWFL
ncbi:hypothetical protein HAX54_027936 [Datura stramonium]|uniref:Uncharacterized protein n=1 Tax=Datura stramonium TaxID=4076 RepID=A0ABS8V462_DATST|nr:hypothetical protein [Datura stramonium]